MILHTRTAETAPASEREESYGSSTYSNCSEATSFNSLRETRLQRQDARADKSRKEEDEEQETVRWR